MSIAEELYARWRTPWPTPFEEAQLDRKYGRGRWCFPQVSETEISFKVLGRDDRFSETLSENREKLRREKIDLFTSGYFEPMKEQRMRAQTRSSVAKFSQAIAAEAGRQPPEWLKLIPGGLIKCRDDRGPFEMTNTERVIEATKSLDMMQDAGLPIDLNHQTDIAAKEGGDAPAVGWIRELAARGGDLFGRVEWTAKGKAALTRGPNGEPPAYRYISPVFAYDPRTHEVTQLVRAGLTNNPNLFRMAICTSRNSRENAHSLSTDELAICRNLGIRREEFAARKEMSNDHS